MFARTLAIAAGESSAKRQVAAPRESASKPSAPEPAKRSSTAPPGSGPRRLKSASRTRSDVGRTSRPLGAVEPAPAERLRR